MRILVLMLSLTLTGQTFAQKNLSIHLENSVNAIFGTYRGITSPQISWKKNNKEFSFGPSILVATEIAASDKRFPKLVGFQFNYKAYQGISTKKVNFYFYDDLTFNRIVDRWNSSTWNEEISDYSDYGYSSTEIIVYNHIGYGFELRLAKKLILRQAVGVGFYYSAFDGNEDSDQAPSLSDTNINGYSPFGFSYQIKIGLGVNL